MSIFVLSLPSLLLFILFLQVFLYPFRPVSFASLSTLLLLDSLLRNSDPLVICELFLFSFMQSLVFQSSPDLFQSSRILRLYTASEALQLCLAIFVPDE